MLKTTRSSDKSASSSNNSRRSASNKNNDSKPAFWRNDSNGEVNEFDVGRNGVEHTKKSEKLFKSGKSKSQKISKSRNLAKSGKKLLKRGNSTNSNTIEDESKFLTPDARISFNRL